VREQGALWKFGNHCIRECGNAQDEAVYLENLATIAELFAQGHALEFDALFADGARRIPLPTYPFADERYWVGSEPRTPPAVVTAPRPIAASGIEAELSQMARELLSLGDAPLDLDRVLLDLGFDSLTLTKFAFAINEKYGLAMTPVLFFDHPSIGALAKYLRSAQLPIAVATESVTIPAAIGDEILQRVVWENAAIDDEYEKLTF
jgi:acyl carrier protein